MLGSLVSVAKAAYAFRKMRGEFNPSDLWWIGGMILIAFLCLWYVLTIMIPDLWKWW